MSTGMNEIKTALITGASSGIGLAVSNLLLKNDYRVIGISRRGSGTGPDQELFTGISLDLANLQETSQCIGELIEQYRFDCFIHAAGCGHFGSIEQFSVTQLDQSIRVNLTSALILCRQLIPAFRRQKRGRIIFIGSESALIAGKKGALYSAAKFGIRGLCQALRQDCASDGINVSLINPGMVRSPFFDDLSFRPGERPENAIEVEDIASVIWQILQSSPDMVFDEVNVSPRVKSIDFSTPPG